jgi:mono/diheme cytochrome c family protein
MRAQMIKALALATLAFAAAATAAEGDEGERVYNKWCSHCHNSGRGNPGTESLRFKYGDKIPAVLLERSDLTPQAVTTFVRTGVMSMPPFRKTEISDAELTALSAYIAQANSRNKKKK